MPDVDSTALRQLFLAIGKDREAANRLFLTVFRLCALVGKLRTYPLVRPADEDEELLLAGRSRAACARYFGEAVLEWQTLSLSEPGPHLLEALRGGTDPASGVLTCFISEAGVGHERNALLQLLEGDTAWEAALTCIGRGIDRRTEDPWAQERLRQMFRLTVLDFLRLHAVSTLLGDPMAERTAPIIGMLHECVPLLARRDPLRLVVLIG